MSNCPICTKHSNLQDALHETDHWVITHGPLDSQLLGYLYIEPKRHVENWAELTADELSEIGMLIQKAEAAVKKETNIDRLYVVTISEAVRHLHFHLIPREEGSDVKGLPLIEQATQQKVKNNEHIMSEEFYVEKIAKIKQHLTEIG
ncbi:HIT family protein [Bacillus taeanensis]|uniref:Diadenosine tetraphosphate hydrolase n=1 Tax=Bacillus taeanensis TaxID=273032 RepID=A0A366XXP8_9BACI|nr:HIT family protein [Bacillus taeanensis]RBW68903.1 diadenosine tetraphosphate hydrolase [Bacillus taeanensis]